MYNFLSLFTCLLQEKNEIIVIQYQKLIISYLNTDKPIVFFFYQKDGFIVILSVTVRILKTKRTSTVENYNCGVYDELFLYVVWIILKKVKLQKIPNCK